MTAQTLSPLAVQPPARRKPISTGKIVAWIVVGLAIFITVAPFWMVIVTALSSRKDLIASPGTLWPVGFTWINFLRVLGQTSLAAAQAAGGSGQSINFWLYLRNSVIVAVLTVAGQTFFSAMAAYAFARLKFPLREQIFFMYLAALMVPAIVTLIPNYVLIHRDLHLDNTFAGIVAPGFFMSPFAVFFLRQFFLGINRELEEAASLDGASAFAIFWRVILPISVPPIATLAILTFVGTWNSYLWPFLVGKDESVRVLTVALAIFKSQTPQGLPDWTGLMAATIVSVLPTVLVFVVFGRRVVNSIQFTGFK
jgi:multiple sugar transport system permease protein